MQRVQKKCYNNIFGENIVNVAFFKLFINKKNNFKVGN